jgi:hypothetical protein
MKNNKNFNNKIDDLFDDIDLPDEEQVKADTKSQKISLRLKGMVHSEQTKQKFAKAKIGKKRNKKSVEKSRVGIIQTKWEQSLQRLSKEDILAAQEKHGNHQQNTMKELGVSFHFYKKLCKHYGLEKKKSNKEKCEYAIQNQSEKIMVYQCSKREPYRPVGKPKIFYSVSQCCRELELHKGNMLRNMRNGTPYRNMFFKK